MQPSMISQVSKKKMKDRDQVEMVGREGGRLVVVIRREGAWGWRP